MFWKRTGEQKPVPGGKVLPVAPNGRRTGRHSSGWANVLKFLQQNEAAVVMDVGPTSPTNVNFLTSLGCSIYLPDPLHDFAVGDLAERMKSESAAEVEAAVQQFLEDSFSFSGRTFDCVLLWDTLDYLPEPLLLPVVETLYRVTRPGARVLSYYRSKLEPGAGAHRRYHVTASDVVESQAGAGYPQLQVLQNRSVEKLFHQFSESKFLLAGDNLREAVFVR